MSNIDKQALREVAEKALPAMKRLIMMPNDELFDEALLNVDGDVDAANAFNLLTGPETVLALLDELEAKDKRLNEILTPNMLLPVIDDMDADNLRHVIKTCCENYSLLHAKWEAKDKRIAELEKFISQSCYVFDGRDADISDAYIDASTSRLMPKVGYSSEVKPCSYCSDGSYSGLPGGACEHCMGTGLDNPAAGKGA